MGFDDRQRSQDTEIGTSFLRPHSWQPWRPGCVGPWSPMASGVPLGKGALSWGLQQDCRWVRGTPKGRKEVQQGFSLLVGGHSPLDSLLEPSFHSRLFPGFICVFLWRQCSEWQSGGSCLTSEVRSNGLPGASPMLFSSPPPCHRGPRGGLTQVGGRL